MQENTCACGEPRYKGLKCHDCYKQHVREQKKKTGFTARTAVCACGNAMMPSSKACIICSTRATGLATICTVCRGRIRDGVCKRCEAREKLSGRAVEAPSVPYLPTSLRGEGGELLSEPELGLVCPFRAAAVEAILAKRVGQ